MKDPAEPQITISEHLSCAVSGKVANTYQPFRGQRFDRCPQMFIARCEKCLPLGLAKLFRSSIPAAGFDKRQRAIVYHEMFVEENIGGTEPLGKQSPQSVAAYFAPLTCKSGNETFWMLFRGTAYWRFDLKPIAHCRHLTKRYPGLNHTEWAGIHPEKDHAFAAVSVSAQIHFVRCPRVFERVVNAGNGWREPKTSNR